MPLAVSFVTLPALITLRRFPSILLSTVLATKAGVSLSGLGSYISERECGERSEPVELHDCQRFLFTRVVRVIPLNRIDKY